MEKNSLWLSETNAPQYPALSNNIEADVCIIGGGITGITTAYLLQKKGLNVCLLEAQSIGSGVTGHTSGHLTSMVDTYYHQIIKNHSLEAAVIVREATSAARNLAEEIIATNFIPADFKRVTGHYFATDQKQLELLDKERSAMKEAGFDISTLFVWKFPFEILGGFCLPEQSIIDAAAYVRGLAKKCNGKGVKIYESTRVTDYTHEHDRWIIDAGKHQVAAKYMVQATHTPLGFNPVQMEMKPMYSFVLAGKSNAEVVPGLFYDMEEPYHYIRNYDYRGEKMLIIGGSDSKPGDKLNQHQRMEKLVDYARSNFQLSEVNFSWGSMYFEPVDGLPYIGKDPLHKNAFISTGYSGDGLSFGLVGAMLISGLIERGDHPWKSVFDPGRINVSAIPGVLKENAEVIKNLVKDRIKLSSEFIPQLNSGEGKVLKIDGQTIGLALDQEGNFSAVEPVCTHMKCILNWNHVQQSWDCGCHGSRFNTKGEVIAGPATKALKVIEVDAEQPVSTD